MLERLESRRSPFPGLWNEWDSRIMLSSKAWIFQGVTCHEHLSVSICRQDTGKYGWLSLYVLFLSALWHVHGFTSSQCEHLKHVMGVTRVIPVLPVFQEQNSCSKPVTCTSFNILYISVEKIIPTLIMDSIPAYHESASGVSESCILCLLHFSVSRETAIRDART